MEASDIRLRAGDIGRSVFNGPLHYVESGEGPPVVLLHGFPECWYSWRHQLTALAHAGFRAIAPDLRGYNHAQAAVDVASYRVRCLVDDLQQLIEHVGAGPVYLAGHDWGGVLAWRLAALRPQLIRKLAILNAPHPLAFRREMRRNPAQWLRSWYVLFFQLPWLPEKTISARNFALLDRAWHRQPVHPQAFSDHDIACYKLAFGDARGLVGPINYYRAALRYPRDVNAPPHEISMPTLLIWGDRDVALGPRLTEGLKRWVSDLQIVRIPDASHWVQNDAPEQVNRALTDHFQQ